MKEPVLNTFWIVCTIGFIISVVLIVTQLAFAADTKVMDGTLWTRTKICQQSKKLEGKVAQQVYFIIDQAPVAVLKEKVEEAGTDTKFAYKVKATGEVIKTVKPEKEKDSYYVGADD